MQARLIAIALVRTDGRTIDSAKHAAMVQHMAKTVIIRARVNAARKARAAKILKRAGLTPAQAVDAFFAKVAQTGSIPFPTDSDEEIAASPQRVMENWDYLDAKS